jgi:uncharacterized protein
VTARPLAVVTGASSGIGAATARLLATQGWDLVLVARRLEQLQAVANEITGGGGGARVLVRALDAADGDAVLAFANALVAEVGVPALVVNSAGAGQWKYIEDTTPSEAAQMMGAPFQAAYNLCHAFMRPMLAAKRGIFVHVGSPASIMPWPGCVAYACSRFAMRGLHEALCQDLAGTGLHSVHVVLGEVTSSYFEANPDSHQHIPRIARIIPVMSPDQAAAVIVAAVARPRPLVIRPWVLAGFAYTHRLLPGLVSWLVERTGRRRAV